MWESLEGSRQDSQSLDRRNSYPPTSFSHFPSDLPSLQSLYPAYPGYAQEGGIMPLGFSVNPANVTFYQFRFFVQDPSTAVHQSILVNVTNTQSSIFVAIQYPSTTLPGSTNLVNQYTAWVDQVKPVAKANVAQTHFVIILTDSFEYERTQTV